MAICRGVRVPVTEHYINERRGDRRIGGDAGADGHQVSDPSAGSSEDKWYIMHSFRVEGATSHRMDGTAMDVLIMECVGWKSGTGPS